MDNTFLCILNCLMIISWFHVLFRPTKVQLFMIMSKKNRLFYQSDGILQSKTSCFTISKPIRFSV